MNKELIVIAGPTAIGKTTLGIELAHYLGTEIISADSRQIYKEMCIGTAVPDQEERKGIRHHFIQHKSIHDYYNASKYEMDSLHLLEKLFHEYDKILMVGGSGLYIDAVRFGIDDLPEIDPILRKTLLARIENEGLESLRKDLKILDPDTYRKIDLKNPKRIQKALEVSLMTGKPYSSFLTRPRKKRRFRIRMITIDCDRKELYDLINQRVIKMMEMGLLEEVKALYPMRNINALNTVGYKELFEYFDHKSSLDEAIERIQANTRKYARKQLTWFRKDKEALWFHPNDIQDIKKIIHD